MKKLLISVLSVAATAVVSLSQVPVFLTAGQSKPTAEYPPMPGCSPTGCILRPSRLESLAGRYMRSLWSRDYKL